MNKWIITCVAFLSAFQGTILAQVGTENYYGPDTLAAVKSRCDDGGNRILILESKSEYHSFINNIPLFPPPAAYSHIDLYLAKLELKVKVLEELLTFVDDTSRACLEIAPYKMNFIDSLYRVNSRGYTMQIEALYHFNFICFGLFAPGYAPFPVLYDKIERKEINDDSKKIAEVYKIYKKWFDEARAGCFRNYYFPLLDSRYEWRFGSSEKILVKNFPEIQGEPVRWLGKPKRRKPN